MYYRVQALAKGKLEPLLQRLLLVPGDLYTPDPVRVLGGDERPPDIRHEEGAAEAHAASPAEQEEREQEVEGVQLHDLDAGGRGWPVPAGGVPAWLAHGLRDHRQNIWDRHHRR